MTHYINAVMEDDTETEEIKKVKDLIMLCLSGTNSLKDKDEDDEAIEEWFESSSQQLHRDEPLRTKTKNNQLMVIPQFLILLRETLLTHRWQEVISVLIAVLNEPSRTVDTVWKGTCEVLYNEAAFVSTCMEQLVNQVKLLPDVNVKEVLLEYIMYLVTQNRLHDAQETFKSIPKLQGLNKIPSEKSKMVDILFKAYEGLVLYIEWLEEKQKLDSLRSQAKDIPELLHSSSSLDHEQVMKSFADKAVICFDVLQEQKGIWDIFILKHIQLLEFYQRDDEAHNILQAYCARNSDNPNAYKYLYMFLKTRNTEKKELVTILQNLQRLDPSDCMMMDLHQLLLETDNAVLDALPILFDMLDFSCWKDSVHLWNLLAVNLMNALSDNYSDNIKSSMWLQRSTWWPHYHFVLSATEPLDSLGQSPVRSSSNCDLLCYKAVVAVCLMEPENPFCAEVEAMNLNQEQKDLLNRAKYMVYQSG